MGGGGGQGGFHDIGGAYQKGGDGGGAVFIQGSTINGSGSINVGGTVGFENTGNNIYQGGAGGGAGGMVLFKTTTNTFTDVIISGGNGLTGTHNGAVAQSGFSGGNGSTGRFVSTESAAPTDEAEDEEAPTDEAADEEAPTSPTSGFRYLAFYGSETGGGSNVWFHELELTLATPLNGSSEIKYGVNDSGITFTSLFTTNGGTITIFNGSIAITHPALQAKGIGDAVYWYMDLGSSVAADVNGGTYWTYPDPNHQIGKGAMYGTNIDPTTFDPATDVSNWEYICDLNKVLSY
jgi:hypothetical protein